MLLEKWGGEIPSDNIQFSFELYLQRTNLGHSKLWPNFPNLVTPACNLEWAFLLNITGH